MSTEYHDWAGTRKFFRSTLESEAPDQELFSSKDVTRVVWSIESNFVYWNSHQCSTYKEELMTMEVQDSGRVRLRDFYERAMIDNASTFLESVDYLLQLGTIEDVDPFEPRVLISNYIEGPSNCVVRTGYYSVCCMDECVDLYSHLENALRKPAATPDEIIPIVEGLASGSMSQCRKLAMNLVKHLQGIGDRNDGLVLLHGQDFAEWMHLVYPRECAKPSVFGPAHYLTVEEWQEEAHLSAQASYQDMKDITEQLKRLEETRAPSEVGEPLVDDSVESVTEFDEWQPLSLAAVVASGVASLPISFETVGKMALLALALALLPKVSTKLAKSCTQPSPPLPNADTKLLDMI